MPVKINVDPRKYYQRPTVPEAQIRDTIMFHETASFGAVADKDAVAEDLLAVRNAYRELGVPNKTARRSVALLEERFNAADRMGQVRTAGEIRRTLGTLAEATGMVQNVTPLPRGRNLPR